MLSKIYQSISGESSEPFADIITAIDKKLDAALIKNNAYEKINLNGIYFTLIDLHKAYELMVYDLKSKGGLIYAKKC